MPEGQEVPVDVLETQQKHSRVAESVYAIDPYSKALTGRTPERIQEETGISREDMFPKDKKILYVGDPWQRMGKEIDDPNLTIIDYEYGETASFITNDEHYEGEVKYRGEALNRKIDYLFEHGSLSPEDTEWLQGFKAVVTKADEATKEAIGELQQYPATADQWKAAREMIEEAYRKQKEKEGNNEMKDAGDRSDNNGELSYLRTDAWYDCVYGERGLRDLYDYKTIIQPKIEEKRKELSGKGLLPDAVEEQVASWTRTWINEIRLRKKPEKAGVVVAVFPELPFKDNSFDRMVASWSVSAHTFSDLDETGFEECWTETTRVLNAEGKAYFFPLHYSEVDSHALLASLHKMADKNGMKWQFINNIGEVVPDEELDYANTICIQKPAEGEITPKV